MRGLTVLYDSDCALCRGAREWLEGQPKLVPLEFVAAGSEQARSRFPGLAPEDTLREVTVVGTGGEVYRGAKAWVMCLWALREYRLMALRLSAPEMMPVARRVVAWVSKNRKALNRVAGHGPLMPVTFFLSPVVAFPVAFVVYLLGMVFREDLGFAPADPMGLYRFPLSHTWHAFGVTILAGIPLTVILRKHGLFDKGSMVAVGTITGCVFALFSTGHRVEELIASLFSGALIAYSIWRLHTPSEQERAG